jgi:hypothetical protein
MLPLAFAGPLRINEISFRKTGGRSHRYRNRSGLCWSPRFTVHLVAAETDRGLAPKRSWVSIPLARFEHDGAKSRNGVIGQKPLETVTPNDV